MKKTRESLKNFDKESKLSFEATIPFGLLHFDKISTSACKFSTLAASASGIECGVTILVKHMDVTGEEDIWVCPVVGNCVVLSVWKGHLADPLAFDKGLSQVWQTGFE